MNHVGQRSRRRRLEVRGPVNLVALDHGLSMGWTISQDSPQVIAADCKRLGLTGAVVHYGLLPALRDLGEFETFLQLHGSTALDRRKAALALPEMAAAADCVGVAVEYHSAGESGSMATAAKLIQEAKREGLLVLVMANYDGEEFSSMALAAVGATQLGADYVKLRIPAATATAQELRRTKEIITDGPPALVAGGDRAGDLHRTLTLARELGMIGSCIGRHYFDRDSREDAVVAVRSCFK